MYQVRKQNIFNTMWAAVRFVAFWVMVVVQMPILFFLPRGRVSVAYMRVFMRVLLVLGNIKIRVHGKLSSHRPLMVVSNHISVFEIATFPSAIGGSFVSKQEVASWPIVGWVAKKFGVVFVDRRPSHALEDLHVVQERVKHVKYPMIVFAEGTTTNGSYVKPFKSTLFNFVENSDVMVQPVVMQYRGPHGEYISDEDMAEHYGYFDNAKQDQGPKCSRERSAFGQVFHIMVIGGFTVDITVMEPPAIAGMDRKQIADTMYKMVSEKYMEFRKNKK